MNKSFSFSLLSLYMSRFIYLVVSKRTGRTCNAHPVIGGDGVASSWYVYNFFNNLFQYCSLILYFLLYALSSFFEHTWQSPPKCFSRVFFASWQFFVFYLAGDGEGGGDHFGTILGSSYLIFRILPIKTTRIIKQVFFVFFLPRGSFFT